MSRKEKNRLAGIEYAGLPGVSKECQEAVLRLLQYGDQITRVRILTCSNSHCLLLAVNVGDLVAIKSGFSSSYLGEGPRTFSYVLQLLDAHGAQIDEYDVDEGLMERIDSASLTDSDLDYLETARSVRPTRWYDYVFESDWERKRHGTLWKEFRPVIPFAIMDHRITDLILSFWENPDNKLLTGYRRLEDIVRKRTGIDESGSKLFAQAFLANQPRLTWKNVDDSERVGRGNLFTGAYMAYRNPRAHRETETHAEEQLAELLLLNHLYSLEEAACEVPRSGTS